MYRVFFSFFYIFLFIFVVFLSEPSATVKGGLVRILGADPSHAVSVYMCLFPFYFKVNPPSLVLKSYY